MVTKEIKGTLKMMVIKYNGVVGTCFFFSVSYATVYRFSNMSLHSELVNEQSLRNGHSTVRPKDKEDNVAWTES